MTYRSLSILTLALLLGACQASAPGPGVSLTRREAAATPATAEPADVRLAPRVASVAPPSGEARATVRLTVKDAASGYRLAGLPAAWQSLRVTLFSPSASTAFSSALHERTIPAASFSPYLAGQKADATFPALRPATDYRAEVFLTNSAGTVVTARLAGSQSQVIALNPGANLLDFEVTLNGDEATYAIDQTTSEAGNRGESDVNRTFEVFANLALTGGPTEIVNGITLGSDGNLYACQADDNLIGVLTPGGAYSTIATPGYYPGSVVVESDGTLYFTDWVRSMLVRRSPSGVLTELMTALDGLNHPNDLARDAQGALYLTDTDNHVVRKIVVQPTFSASVHVGAVGVAGSTDNCARTLARLSSPHGVAVDDNGVLYIAESGTARVRRVPPTGNVTTLDTAPASHAVVGLTTDAGGTVFYTWQSTDAFAPTTVRRITPDGVATTVADPLDGLSAGNDVAVAPDGTLYLSQGFWKEIKRSRWSPNVSVVVKGDTVTFNTGLQANQPGVEYLLIKLSGAAYGSPASPVLIKRFDRAIEGASWNRFVWNTTVANTAAGTSYVPATLAAGASGTTPQDGQLDFEAYDRYGRLAGKASLPLQVLGAVGDAAGQTGIYFE